MNTMNQFDETAGSGSNYIIGTDSNCNKRGDIDNFESAAFSCEEKGDYAGAAQLFYKSFLAGGRTDYSVLERTVKNLIDGGKISHAAKFVGLLQGKIDECVYKELLSELSMAGYKAAAHEIENNGSGVYDNFDDKFLNKFIDLFSGRENLYALQHVDASGRTGYRPVREKLDAEILMSHLNGELTAGIYPVCTDNSVRFMAFDIDISKHYILNSDDAEIERKLEEAGTLALQIAAKLTSLSVYPLIEFSGNKGYHVWIFFEKPIQAAIAIKFAEIILAKVDLKAYEHIGVEVFPKQSRVGEGGIGNLIKLPLGVHLKTGKRCNLLDIKTLNPVNDNQKTLMEAVFTPEKLICAVENYLREKTQKLNEIDVVSCGDGNRDGNCNEGATVSENRKYSVSIQPLCKKLDKKAIEIKPKKEKVTAFQFELFNNTDISEITNNLSGSMKEMISKCPVLSFLVKKARREKYLTHDERLVILYTVGFAGEGADEAIHRIISECSDYKKEITNHFIKSKRENCMGCYRIRQRLPEIAKFSRCGCNFNLKDRQSYASPLVHINKEFKRVSVINEKRAAESKESALNSVDEAAAGSADKNGHISTIEKAAADYLKFKKQYIVVLDWLKRSKDELLNLMRSEKIDRIELTEGVVCLIDDNGCEKMITSFAPRNTVKV